MKTFDECLSKQEKLIKWSVSKRTQDENRGAKFETYARCVIKGRILDELRQMDPLSRTARSEHPGGGWIDPADLSQLDWSMYYNQGLSDDDGEIFDACLYNERRQQLYADIDRLPKMKRMVIRGRLKDRSLKDIGGELGLSESRVGQIEQEAIEELKAKRYLREYTA